MTARDPVAAAAREVKRRAAHAAERLTRALLRGIDRCALCGRSAGDMRRGDGACAKCRNELAPTRAHQAREALGFSTRDVAELARVSVPSIARVMRGEPAGRRVSERVAPILDLSPAQLRAGEPSPFRSAA